MPSRMNRTSTAISNTIDMPRNVNGSVTTQTWLPASSAAIIKRDDLWKCPRTRLKRLVFAEQVCFATSIRVSERLPWGTSLRRAWEANLSPTNIKPYFPRKEPNSPHGKCDTHPTRERLLPLAPARRLSFAPTVPVLPALLANSRPTTPRKQATKAHSDRRTPIPLQGVSVTQLVPATLSDSLGLHPR